MGGFGGTHHRAQNGGEGYHEGSEWRFWGVTAEARRGGGRCSYGARENSDARISFCGKGKVQERYNCGLCGIF